jgi:hypothetical protein
MQTVKISVDEVEQDRLRRVTELAGDRGADWAIEYQPRSAGCHELLDRTALVVDVLERYAQSHPACVARSDWYLLAEQAAAALQQLYQAVGADHLAAESPPSGAR